MRYIFKIILKQMCEKQKNVMKELFDKMLLNKNVIYLWSFIVLFE